MKARKKLFVYGTLMDKKIRGTILGRMAEGVPDTLNGYVKSEISIKGEIYPLIVLNAGGIIKGLVIEVTRDELRRIDEYETDAYKREKIILESGIPAWVYIKR